MNILMFIIWLVCDDQHFQLCVAGCGEVWTWAGRGERAGNGLHNDAFPFSSVLLLRDPLTLTLCTLPACVHLRRPCLP